MAEIEYVRRRPHFVQQNTLVAARPIPRQLRCGDGTGGLFYTRLTNVVFLHYLLYFLVFCRFTTFFTRFPKLLESVLRHREKLLRAFIDIFFGIPIRIIQYFLEESVERVTYFWPWFLFE